MQSRELAKAQLLEALGAIDPLSDTDPSLPALLSNLAAVYFSERTMEDADAFSQRMILVCQQTVGQSHPYAAAAYNNLAVIWGHEQKSDVATLFENALEIWKLEVEESRPGRLVALNNRTNLYVRKKEFAKALTTASEAQELAGMVAANEDAGIAANNLAVLLQHEHRFLESEVLYKQATDLWQAALGENHEWVALSLLNLASLCRQQQLHEEAERLCQLSMNIRRSATGGTLFDRLSEAELFQVRIIKDDPLNADDALLNSPDYVSIVDSLKRDTLDHIREYIAGMGPWVQNLEVKPGVFTNPPDGDSWRARWRILDPFVPSDLSGKSVLDIGCNAGFFSIQFKRRGARRVVGIDASPFALAQARFVSRWFGQNVELREMAIGDAPILGEFDYVRCSGGVDPERIAAICKDTTYVQSDGTLDPAVLRAAGFREVLETGAADVFVCKK